MLHKKNPQHVVSEHAVSPKVLYADYDNRWLMALDKYYPQLIYHDKALTEEDRSVCLYIYSNKSLVTIHDLQQDLDMPYDLLKPVVKQLEDLGYLLVLFPYIVPDLPNVTHPYLREV